MMQFLKQKAKKWNLQSDIRVPEWTENSNEWMNERIKQNRTRCRAPEQRGHFLRVCLATEPLFLFFFLFFWLLMLVGSVWWEPSQGSQSPPPFTRSALSSGRWQLSCLGVAGVQTGLSIPHSEPVIRSPFSPAAFACSQINTSEWKWIRTASKRLSPFLPVSPFQLRHFPSP